MSKLVKGYKVKSILNKFFIFKKFIFKKIPIIKSKNKYKNIYKLGNKIYNEQIFLNSQENNLKFINSNYKNRLDLMIAAEVNRADFKFNSDEFFSLMQA